MKALVFPIIALFCCTSVSASELSDYKSVKCVVHLHTDISNGARPLESYVGEAKDKGIGAIVLTDTDWRRWEFGLPPFRRLIKKVVQKKSIMTFGIKKYLKLIEETNERYKDIIIIDGIQTNPFYYWSGNLFKGTMALNNRNKDMLVIGLGNAGDYENMPSVVNHKSRFDAYHGDKFTRPYQDLIDYVIKRGGLIFWSHPEYEENTIQDGINLITVPYQWDLVGTYDYTGFGIFWEGYREAGKPKGLWDRILTEYCQGKRKSPIWAIGELEEEGSGNKDIDDIVNMVHVKNLSRQQILDALKEGRFYVTLKISYRVPLALKEFTLSDESGAKAATMGEWTSFSDNPVIKISVTHERPTNKDITVRLIRNNEIIKESGGNEPIEIEYKDDALAKDKKYYYRIDVTDDTGNQLVSNPIFFNKR